MQRRCTELKYTGRESERMTRNHQRGLKIALREISVHRELPRGKCLRAKKEGPIRDQLTAES